MSVYISFDIDGTLVIPSKVKHEHHQAFADAITELFAPACDPPTYLQFPVRGWMDNMIISAMIKKAGFESTKENLDRAIALTEEKYVQNAKLPPTVLPGVAKTLKYLATLPNVYFGIASGNLYKIAWKKLELAGISDLFPHKIGGYGTAESRAQAILDGFHEAEKVAGHKIDHLIHVGDTPFDIDAGHKAGGISIGVLNNLSNGEGFESPELVIDDLETEFDKFVDTVQQKLQRHD